MGRSNGYRPKAACREEVLELRAQLAQCRGQDWAKAGMIMQHIAALVGTPLGPMNGRVMPRACKFCDHYGHTRQWCKVREAALKAQEEREIEAMLKEDETLRAKYKNTSQYDPTKYDPTKAPQAIWMDSIRMPYIIHPLGIGPIIGGRREEHHGKWTFDGDGRIVPNPTYDA